MNRRLRGWILSATLLVGVVSVVFASRDPLHKVNEVTSPAAASLTERATTVKEDVSPSPTLQEDSPSDDKVVLLTLRPNGFSPRELTLPAGRYLFVVRNRTGLAEFSFRIERESGEVLHEVSPRRYKREWKHMVQLPVGVYIVKEVLHPDWTCHITVTANWVS